MITQLGKQLRIIRINTGDSMRKMADKLGVSVSYLSAIENGKRNVPEDFGKKIEKKYSLSDKDKENIEKSIQEQLKKVNITELSATKKNLMFELAKSDLDDDTIRELSAIIKKKKSGK